MIGVAIIIGGVAIIIGVEIIIGGGGGGATGVAELLDADSRDVATPFPNFTLNVYAVPFDKPLTLIGEVADVPVMSDGVEVAV